MIKIVITGANGYIGQNIIAKLKKNNEYSIHAIDLKYDKKTKIEGVYYHEGDLLNEEITLKLTKNCHAIIHLASVMKNEDSNENVIMTKNLLNACKKNNINKFVFSSTFQCYGKNASLNCNETHLLAPISLYAKSKVTCETLIKDYTVNNKMDATVLRYFNVYGSGCLNGILGLLSRQAEGKIIMLQNDGNDIRDFVYIDDVVNATCLALRKENITRFSIYNIGSNQGIKISEVVKIIAAYNHIKTTFGEKKEQIREISSDNTLAEKELNYKVKTNISDGIKKIMSYNQ
ncbi:MAG: NAD(P)-dependent oxidoreductase [Clostridiales bacterium]|nr:NAD(P)-dependent oxidoreductase [Clostridiales bacterium]